MVKSMPIEVGNKGRNESIECFRVIASVFVVFIHCQFPGTLGSTLNCLARFAVPFFFAVSGYFAFQLNEKTLKKRAAGVFRLNIYATLLYLLWGSYKVRYIELGSRAQWLIEKLSERNLAKWFVIGANPFGGHLWYLSAALICYVILYLYVQWWEGKTLSYRPLYFIGICLYSVQVLMGSIGNAAGFVAPHLLYRNALFFGLPMFALGIFLHEYQSRIIMIYRLTRGKCILIIIVGACVSLLQWRGLGEVEMPIGTLFEVVALILLLVSVPRISGNSRIVSMMITKLGGLSTYIYITHLFWLDIYYLHGKKYMLIWGEEIEAYLYPIAIVLVSLLSGIVWQIMCSAMKRFISKLKALRRPVKN